jgi:hypothetical protein
LHGPNRLDLRKNINVQSFEIVKVPILGLALGSLRKKCHLNVTLAYSHKIYYREGSGASSQML